MRKRTQKQPDGQAPTDQPAVLEKLLTVSDVADLLQVSRVLVYQLMYSQGLPSMKIKGARRFRPADVQAWINRQAS